jgi:hypothetical protein
MPHSMASISEKSLTVQGISVIYHEDVLHAHKSWHHALEHLAFGFLGVQLLPAPP